MFTHRKQLVVYHRAIRRAVRQCLVQPLMKFTAQRASADLGAAGISPGNNSHSNRCSGSGSALNDITRCDNNGGDSRGVVVDFLDLFEDVAFASIGAACFGEATWFAVRGL